MSEQLPNGNAKNEPPPPLYANDKAWTVERQIKAEVFFNALNKDRAAKREHAKETLGALRDLIEECDDAVNRHPDGQSVLLQMLYATYFVVTKDKI